MPAATRQTIARVPPKVFYSVITDYESYPDFVDGLTGCRILSKKKTTSTVLFEMNLIKKFEYTIKTKERANKSLEWTLVDSNLLTLDNGSWKLIELEDGFTEVTYSLELGFGRFVPKMLVDKMTDGMLPKMLAGFVERAEKIAGVQGPCP